MKRSFPISLLLLFTFFNTVLAQNQDPGWPRTLNKNGAVLIYYQPQIDEWKDQKVLDARMAVSLNPAGASKPTIGVVAMKLRTDVDVDSHSVLLKDLQITRTYFPSLDPNAAAQMDQLVRSFLRPDFSTTISLERLVASAEKPKAPRTATIKNNPPTIFVSNSPAVLLLVNGEPIRAPIEKTNLESLVNANWPVIFDKKSSKYYLLAEKQWLTSSKLESGWTSTTTLPKDMSKLTEDPNWEDLKGAVPPPATSKPPPRVFFSKAPAEIITFQGPPVYSKIPGTQLVYATNTDSDVFVYSPSKTYYYLTAGRWFSAATMTGPWKFASADLPADFAKIPSSSPASRILVSVPGTPEAADAVLMAQIPTTATVDPAAAQKVKIAYSGEPQFKPIEGTSLQYAVNTPDKVIKAGDLYYVCFQGIWFTSTSPQGPWETAKSVPQEIYSIPPSSPVYNVTYVTQTVTPSGSVESSYTAGYLGTFVTGLTVGVVIAGGTGYYYPPYVYYPRYGYPVYYPYAVTYGMGGYYNPYTRVYGVGGAAYGPYGGARWGTAYNPHTGTYARGATAYGPYGARSAGQAYNPYTGAYGATRQGGNAYSQWGGSVVTRGNQAVATQHYSDARGTIGSAQTAAGGRAVAGAGAYGSGYAARTAGGDMYAGRDGNVYRNTNGNWQKYDNGNWNSVDTSAAQQRSQSLQQDRASAQRSMSSSDMKGLQQDFQNRQRGAAQTERVQSFQRSGGRGGGGFRRR